MRAIFSVNLSFLDFVAVIIKHTNHETHYEAHLIAETKYEFSVLSKMKSVVLWYLRLFNLVEICHISVQYTVLMSP
jgi:hypothetical protein